jgi:hypothetical protein
LKQSATKATVRSAIILLHGRQHVGAGRPQHHHLQIFLLGPFPRLRAGIDRQRRRREPAGFGVIE